ncbi:hypothetical protein E2C01_031902 [Portunus trituberculatus]|uniref:Uncharacterized protein n=1 Tax=Portunus trituberculatus TaxID=210409 RepID=A0A5B7EZ45_PORTR|nr:hypothetical protein [Portunus trituberculatus]
MIELSADNDPLSPPATDSAARSPFLPPRRRCPRPNPVIWFPLWRLESASVSRGLPGDGSGGGKACAPKPS